MGGTHSVAMGDRGRLVVPLELRERWGLEPGTTLIFLETPDGLVLATREQALTLVRRQVQGASLVEELLAERRAASAQEDEVVGPA